MRREGVDAILPCPECRTRERDALEIWTATVQETTTGLLPAAIKHFVSGGVIEELRRVGKDEQSLCVEVLDDYALEHTYLNCQYCEYKQSLADIPIPLDVLMNYTYLSFGNLVPARQK